MPEKANTFTSPLKDGAQSILSASYWKEAAKNLDMRDVVKAGEEKLDEIKLAELILEKSGQDVKKRKERFKSGKERLRLKNFEQPKEKDKQKNDAVKKKNLDLGR